MNLEALQAHQDAKARLHVVVHGVTVPTPALLAVLKRGVNTWQDQHTQDGDAIHVLIKTLEDLRPEVTKYRF